MRLNKSLPADKQALPAISLIGSTVDALCQASACGTVLMTFERSCYLQFESQLICLGLRELGASSITALFDSDCRTLPSQLTPGTAVRFTANQLWIDGGYSFDAANACRYVSITEFDLSRCGQTMTSVALLTQLKFPDAGLAPLLQARLNNHQVHAPLIEYAQPLIDKLLAQVRCVCAAAAIDRSEKFRVAAFQKLIGAGPGLTPSGDDFVCGVFAALHLSGHGAVAQQLWVSIRPISAVSTTLVSLALLEQAAFGELSERLDALILAGLNYPDSSAQHISGILSQIGETSGWDWLAGFVLCMHAMESPHYRDAPISCAQPMLKNCPNVKNSSLLPLI